MYLFFLNWHSIVRTKKSRENFLNLKFNFLIKRLNPGPDFRKVGNGFGQKRSRSAKLFIKHCYLFSWSMPMMTRGPTIL